MAGRYFETMSPEDLRTTQRFYSQRKLLLEADARSLHSDLWELHLQKEIVHRHFNARWNPLGPTFQHRGQGQALQRAWAEAINPIETLMLDKHAELTEISHELWDIKSYLAELDWRLKGDE
jgi:hypothetical protein